LTNNLSHNILHCIEETSEHFSGIDAARSAWWEWKGKLVVGPPATQREDSGCRRTSSIAGRALAGRKIHGCDREEFWSTGKRRSCVCLGWICAEQMSQPR